MENIHFSTNGQVGINLSADEQPNGAMTLIRVYLSGTPVTELAPLAGLTQLTTLDLGGTKVTDLTPGEPELFTVRPEERHGLMEYLNRSHSHSKRRSTMTGTHFQEEAAEARAAYAAAKAEARAADDVP